jgi:hypothetical protein
MLAGDAGAKALGQALRVNRKLQRIYYDGNGVGLEGWKAIRGAFYGNKKVIEMSYPTEDLGMAMG